MSYHHNLRGADLHAPTNELVENNTGSAIPTLTVVALNGLGTNYPQVISGNPNLYNNFGITQASIATGATGYVTVLGFLFNVNTSLWPVNTVLYSTTAGALSTTALGSPVAYVVSQNATYGILYVFGGLGLSASSNVTAWDLDGNNGVTTGFLGTTDANDLRVKTNNQQVAVFDVNGRFGLGEPAPTRHVEFKAHTGATASGVQVESFILSTTSPTYQDGYVITLDDPQSVQFEVSIQGKDVITGDVCSFKRVGAFYRNAGNATLMPQGWQSTFTSKTNNQMNVRYTLNTTDVSIQVKGLNVGNLTNWTGYIILQELKV
jgi:hypothetical protein